MFVISVSVLPFPPVSSIFYILVVMVPNRDVSFTCSCAGSPDCSAGSL